MAAFPTTVQPAYGISKRSQPKVKRVSFMDGFEQRQLIGIAAQKNGKVYNLVFNNISETESDEIEYFLNERALDQASFTYTPPNQTTVKTGTYSQSGTTITVTVTDHQLFANDSITVDFTSGSATDGTFSVVSLTSANVFVITAGSSATNSGNCTVTKTGTSNFVCETWSKTIPYANRATLNCTFREVFEP